MATRSVIVPARLVDTLGASLAAIRDSDWQWFDNDQTRNELQEIAAIVNRTYTITIKEITTLG